jgi:hypothetical protein
MIELKRIPGALTFENLNDVGRLFPVIYVFFDGPGLEALLTELLADPEPGEVAVIADYDAASEVCRKFGISSRDELLAFVLSCPAGSKRKEEYADAIQWARKWRRKNAKAEERWLAERPGSEGAHP